MAKLPYVAAESSVDESYDIMLASNDNAFVDPWSMFEDYVG